MKPWRLNPTARACAAMLARGTVLAALAAPGHSQAAGACSAYMGQVVVNEWRVGASNASDAKNQVEFFNSGNVAPAVWQTWSTQVWFKDGATSATRKGTYPLSTGHTANGQFIYNNTAKYFSQNKDAKKVDIALLDANGDFIAYLAIEGTAQTVPACFGATTTVQAATNKDEAGRIMRTTDGGAWPAALTKTSVHTIGRTNACSASGDIVINHEVNYAKPVQASTTVTYTTTAFNNACSTKVSGAEVTVTNLSTTNFSARTIAVSGGCGSAAGTGSIDWDIGDLAAGETCTLTFTGKSSNLGALTSVATATKPTTGLINTGDDNDSASITTDQYNYIGFDRATDTATEGTDTAGSAVVVINVPSTQATTVNYTVGGTAGSVDHNATSGSVVIAAGESNASINFTITNDSLRETTKSIVFTITSVTSTDAAVKRGTAGTGDILSTTVTLFDDDASAQLIARYDLEEGSWSGTAGELKDTAGYSGGPFNGKAKGSPLPSTATAGPARPGSTGSCRYASLLGPAANGSAFIVSGLPVSTSSGAQTTVSFWMYWNGAGTVMPLGWLDQNLFFYIGAFGFNSNNADVYGASDSGLVNVWRHVVAVFTNGSFTANMLYIDGVEQTLTQRVGTPILTRATVDTTMHFGGFGRNSDYRLVGGFDQLRVYNGAVSASDVATLFAEARACLPTVDHYELSTPSAAVSCLSSTVTVTACADTSSPCTNAAATINGQTATLATSNGTLGSATLTFNGSGVATTTLNWAAAPNGGTAAVTLSAEQTTASSPRKCCPNGSACSVANSCSTAYSTAGFIVAAAAGGAATTVPSQVAGTASAGYFLRAVQTSTSTKACEAAITGVGNVNWSYQCNNPSTCSASNLMTLTGNAATTIARNNHGSTASSTAVAMTFDANGNAPFSFNYADVGQVTLNAGRPAGGSLLTALSGATNAFVVRPGGFAISNLQQTAAPQLANPVAANAAGAKFVKAGEAFSATVTARTSGGATAPNYGRETAPEGVLLTHALVLPAGGAAGTLSNATIAGGSFTSGVATVTNLAFSEVGIISLTPRVGDGSYLGAGDTTGTTTGNIGRFFPAQFALSAGSVTHRLGLGCAPASAFSYLGENFRLALTLTAQNTAGATTTNYTSTFAKLDPTTATWNLAGRDATTVFTVASARLSLGSATGSFNLGVASGITLTANAARAAAPDGPFSANFGVAPVDSDGVAMAAFNTASISGGGNDRALVASVPLRFGRLRLGNAAGAADRVLALPVAAQSWNGSAFDTNTLDSCTAVATTAMNFGNLRGTLTTADTAASGSVVLTSGAGTLRLAAPGGGRSGTYDVALSLGSSATDASCLQSWTPAVGDVATAGANLAYLRGNHCASTYSNDPAARATFGRPRGVDSLVYRRENF